MGGLDISVVIPAYRAAGTICRAVDSVLNQSRGAAEIIVIDDGSPDDVAAPLRKYGQRVTYIRKSNGGVASARNLGIDQAKGDLIAFLDADDHWEPQKLSRQAEIFQQHPDVGLAATRYFLQEPGGQPVLSERPEDEQLTDRPLRASGPLIFQFVNRIWTSAVVVRRSMLGNHRFVRELEPAEDRDMWLRLVTSTAGYLISEPLATAVLEPQSLSRSDAAYGYRPMIEVLRRHAALVSTSDLRKLEAFVFRGWAATALASGRPRKALHPAWNRLRREMLLPEAWWVLAKSLVMSVRGGNVSQPRPA